MDIRFINKDEYEISNDFYNQTYKKNRSMKQWAWEFSTLRKENIPFAVVNIENKILGTQALMPIQLIDSEGVFLSAKSEETLLHPTLRGKNAFKSMYDLLFDYAEKNDIEVIWGFTHATKAFKRVGFEVPCSTSQYFFPLSSKVSNMISSKVGETSSSKKIVMNVGIGLAKNLSKFKFALHKNNSTRSKFRIEVANEPPEEASQLCKDFIANWGGVTIYRDFDYLNWRVYNNPYVKPILKTIYFDSKLIGWIVYSVGHDYMGYILDIIVASPDNNKNLEEEAVEALMANAVSSIITTGAVGIRGWSVGNHPFNNLVVKSAKNLGFYFIQKGEHMVLHFSGSENSTHKHTSIKNVDSWYVTRIFTEGIDG